MSNKVIEKAVQYIGVVTGSQKHLEIIEAYNNVRESGASRLSPTSPWCAGYVVAMFAKAGLTNLVPRYASCSQMISKFKQWNQFHSAEGQVPEVGDVIYFDWGRDGIPDHVGLVESVRGNEITTIEGNYNGAVRTRKIFTSDNRIFGYGIPKYEPNEGTTTVYPYYSLSDSDRAEIDKLPVLRQGSSGVFVKILQTLMNVYSDDILSVDGVFGPVTKGAVMKYQRKEHLGADGVVGKQTWSSFMLR